MSKANEKGYKGRCHVDIFIKHDPYRACKCAEVGAHLEYQRRPVWLECSEKEWKIMRTPGGDLIIFQLRNLFLWVN